MNPIVSRMVSTGVLLLLVFLSGFWLSRSGKPYPVILFTLHKLIALGAVIFLTMIVYKIHQASPLHTIQMIAPVITALFLIATIITGGLGSLDKGMPVILLRIHQVIPYLTVISVGATLYLLLLRGSQLTSTSY